MSSTKLPCDYILGAGHECPHRRHRAALEKKGDRMTAKERETFEAMRVALRELLTRYRADAGEDCYEESPAARKARAALVLAESKPGKGGR